VVIVDTPFTASSREEAWALITDLSRLIPCVSGGTVVATKTPADVDAEIKVKMGAMSLRFVGSVAIVEEDAEAGRALLRVKSRESNGQGDANADVTFTLGDDGGTVHTEARVTGKAASMGEGVVTTVLDALIRDFAKRFDAATGAAG
jgi:carbon monoxide dehydrogenase subunit G